MGGGKFTVPKKLDKYLQVKILSRAAPGHEVPTVSTYYNSHDSVYHRPRLYKKL